MSGRTIVLGVDSLDLALVERWAAAGMLPFFSELLQTGPMVRLSAVSRVLQGALWPSLLTGRSPGHHGTFYLTQLTSGTYDFDQVRADHYQPDTYYGRLDKHGVRCAIVDVPYDVPIDGFGGLHVVDWLTEFQTWRFTTQPATRRSEIAATLGTLSEKGGYGPTDDSLEGHRKLPAKLEKALEMKFALVADLLQRDDLDHIFAVFGEPHKAGHFLWKYMDPTHPEHVIAEPALRDAILAVYRLLDRRLGELAKQLSAGDNLLVFADHGMQANYRGDHLVGPILERLGLCGSQRALRLDEPSGDRPTGRATAVRARAVAHAVLRRIAPDFITRSLRRKFGSAARMDWRQVRMFQLPTDRNSYLRVNLRGREPEGTVAPGAEYEELLTQVESEFRALRNVRTGKPAVEEVFRVQKLYPGPRAHELPDLAILWSSDAPLEMVESPRLGLIQRRVVEDRSGNHHAEGFLLARGPAINSQVRRLHGDIMQIPATLLALHGVPSPAHYEMPPLHDLLATSSTRRATAA